MAGYELLEWLRETIVCYGEIDFYLPDGRRFFLGREYENNEDEILVVRRVYASTRDGLLFEGSVNGLIMEWLYDGQHTIEQAVLEGILGEDNFDMA